MFSNPEFLICSIRTVEDKTILLHVLYFNATDINLYVRYVMIGFDYMLFNG
jgi:hypothetical protein